MSPRTMLGTITAALALALVTTPAQAQRADRLAIELRPFAGAFIPTGDQRDVLDDAALLGAQLGVAVHPNVTLLGSFGWAPSADKTLATDNTVDLYQYDLGIELHAFRPLGATGWRFKPFAGAGLGGRTYHYRDQVFDAQSYFAGYGALGAELQSGRFGVRLEGRDYLSNFRGLRGDEASSTRNDVTLALGISYRFR